MGSSSEYFDHANCENLFQATWNIIREAAPGRVIGPINITIVFNGNSDLSFTTHFSGEDKQFLQLMNKLSC